MSLKTEDQTPIKFVFLMKWQVSERSQVVVKSPFPFRISMNMWGSVLRAFKVCMGGSRTEKGKI